MKRVKKSLMSTWEDMDVDYDEEEANMALMASTSSDADSYACIEDDEIFFEFTH